MKPRLSDICLNYNRVYEKKVMYWYSKCNFECDGKNKECTAYNGVRAKEYERALWNDQRLEK